MENKSYEELYKDYEQNKKRLIELDKIYNKNLDQNFIPYDQEEMDKTLSLIRELQNRQREINKRMSELKPYEEEVIIEGQIIEEDVEPTIELPKVKEEKKLISNLRIIFDGKNGLYIVKYLENNEEKTKLFTIDKELLKNSDDEYIYKGKKYKDLDFNVVKALGELDKELNTDYKDKYITNDFNSKIIYDFRKLSIIDSTYLNYQQKKKLKKQAKKYKKTHTNCNIINFSTKKAAVLLGLSLAGAASGIGLSTKTPKVENQNKVIVELKEEKIKTEEKHNENVKTEEKTVIKETKEEVKKDEKITTEEVKEENVEEIREVTKEEKIDDTLNLENIDLYNSAFDEDLGLSSRGNTNNIIGDNYTFDHFESSLIVVTYGPEVVELIKYNTTSQSDLINKCNELKNKYKESYGDDIKISLNINACDANNNVISKDAGWFNSDNINLENENVMHR